MAEIVIDRQAFPREAAHDLQDLLAHELATNSPQTRRQARLGLLIELVSTNTSGAYITTTAYEEARRKRPEDWPDSSSLSRAYGHWLAVVRVATRFWFDGSSRIPTRPRARSYRPYTSREILSSLIGFWQQHDQWPTEWEWDEYADICRGLARQAGQRGRFASRSVIRRIYGSFDQAVWAAQSHVARARGCGRTLDSS